MTATTDDWEARINEVWGRVDLIEASELIKMIDLLARERRADDPVALFERACARDTAGLESQAEPLYRAALASQALDEYRRARANIQLGSTLRALGRLKESEELLKAELDRYVPPNNAAPLRDEARAILALTYLEQGRADEAAGLLLHTLGPHLSRYQRTIAIHAARWIRHAW